MITVFSVDPPNAWALMTEREVFRYGRIPVIRTAGRINYEAWAQRWRGVTAAVGEADVFGIEAIYLHDRGDDDPHVRKGKQRGSLVLARRAGMIEGFIRSQHPAGSVEIVTSGDWRKTSGFLERTGREALKAASVALVKQLYGLDVSHDAADAILIGRHLAIVTAVAP